ncbi:hypothetical protein V6N13_121528 [Hibiscus sabdariffa]|uniref:Uncharacterized protein n=1 Tax=Hibiscus sabdariffa TaxID=183260 RepID=A0ABR2ASQ7_9ROSI
MQRPQTPSEAFGPWMVMEKKHRRTNKQTKPANPQTQDNDFLVPNQLMPMLRALLTPHPVKSKVKQGLPHPTRKTTGISLGSATF